MNILTITLIIAGFLMIVGIVAVNIIAAEQDNAQENIACEGKCNIDKVCEKDTCGFKVNGSCGCEK